MPGATLLLGWGEVDQLEVTTAGQTIKVLPEAGAPRAWGFGSPIFPSISRDGKLVACLRVRASQPPRASVAVYSVPDGKWTDYEAVSGVDSVAITPDGSRLAFAKGGERGEGVRLHFIDCRSGAKSAGPSIGHAARPSWSPDGRQIVYELNRAFGTGGREQSVMAVDVETGKIWAVADGEIPSWSPSGEWIAYLDQLGNRCNIVRPDGTGTRTVVTLHSNGKASVANGILSLRPVWSPDSSKLIVTSIKTEGIPPEVLVVDIATGKINKFRSSLPVLGWTESK